MLKTVLVVLAVIVVLFIAAVLVFFNAIDKNVAAAKIDQDRLHKTAAVGAELETVLFKAKDLGFVDITGVDGFNALAKMDDAQVKEAAAKLTATGRGSFTVTRIVDPPFGRLFVEVEFADGKVTKATPGALD